MATFTSLSRNRLAKLEDAVRKGFAERGIRAKVKLTASGLPGRYRMSVVAKGFEDLIEAERHSIIRDVLYEHWRPEDRLRLTLYLALTPAEAKGVV